MIISNLRLNQLDNIREWCGLNAHNFGAFILPDENFELELSLAETDEDMESSKTIYIMINQFHPENIYKVTGRMKNGSLAYLFMVVDDKGVMEVLDYIFANEETELANTKEEVDLIIQYGRMMIATVYHFNQRPQMYALHKKEEIDFGERGIKEVKYYRLEKDVVPLVESDKDFLKDSSIILN